MASSRGISAATQIAIALYVVYNIAASITSFPAGGDVPALLRRPAGQQVRFHAGGISTNFPAPGRLHHWAPTSDGAWLGWVSYTMTTTDAQLTARLAHYVPANLLRIRTPRSTRRAR